MFKMVILKRLYNISDAQAEYQIKDRLSFMKFLGLSICTEVPDERTIWLFREHLVKAQVMDSLFTQFLKEVEKQNLITRTGSIDDRTFVDVPKQRNSREENKTVKEGTVPAAWNEPGKEHMKAQKDCDARWTKKNNETQEAFSKHKTE